MTGSPLRFRKPSEVAQLPHCQPASIAKESRCQSKIRWARAKLGRAADPMRWCNRINTRTAADLVPAWHGASMPVARRTSNNVSEFSGTALRSGLGICFSLRLSHGELPADLCLIRAAILGHRNTIHCSMKNVRATLCHPTEGDYGVIKGDIRSLDYGSYTAIYNCYPTVAGDTNPYILKPKP